MSGKVNIPRLKSITITDYDLYNNGNALHYNFIDGLNLFIGGNGTGKTTFISILQYALVGAYTGKIQYRRRKFELTDNNEFEVKVTSTRSELPPIHFKSRMLSQNPNAKVNLKFEINSVLFEVERSLYEHNFIMFKINDEIFSNDNNRLQKKYELDRKTNKEIDNYIYYQYEKEICNSTGFLAFDDFINFIKNVTIFDERRETFLWKNKEQNELLNNYTAPVELEYRYNKLIAESKIHDSNSRHESENAKPLKKLLKTLKEKTSIKKDSDSNINYEDLIDKENRIIEKLESEQSNLLLGLHQYNLRKEAYNKTIRLETEKQVDLNKQRNEALNNAFSKVIPNINPQYEKYHSDYTIHNVCPMCYTDVDNVKHTDSNSCFLCNSQLQTDVKSESADLSSLHSEINNCFKKIANNKKALESIIEDINLTSSAIDNITVEIDKSKANIIRYQTEKLAQKPNTVDESTALELEINEYTRKMNEHKKISKKKKKEASEVLNEINKYKIAETLSLSSFFSDYVFNFIEMHAELIFPNDEEMKTYVEDYELDNDTFEKVFVPVIDQIPRIFENELSESQRFFIDQSFRFSIFNHFNWKGSLFICETPSSSLDISFEKNAASVYSNFLNGENNSLIITSNFNQNDFLKYLIKKSNNVNFLNFYEVGRTNNVQRQNQDLQRISKEVEDLLNERIKL